MSGVFETKAAKRRPESAGGHSERGNGSGRTKNAVKERCRGTMAPALPAWAAQRVKNAFEAFMKRRRGELRSKTAPLEARGVSCAAPPDTNRDCSLLPASSRAIVAGVKVVLSPIRVYRQTKLEAFAFKTFETPLSKHKFFNLQSPNQDCMRTLSGENPEICPQKRLKQQGSQSNLPIGQMAAVIPTQPMAAFRVASSPQGQSF